MQHISLASCGSAPEISSEIDRLCERKLIPEDFNTPNICKKIAEFFASDMGRKICGSNNVLREFKFSVLTDSAQLGLDLQDEKILLQGVVDFALLEADGITILDYKTDSLHGTDVSTVIGKYKSQLNAYADALSRIFKMPIKSKQIYFFSAGLFAEV